MICAVLLGAALAAAPVPLASVGLRAPAAQKELAESLGGTLALRMGETKLVKVTTPDDVAAVLGLERQRQLLGCGETSCLAELAGALGSKAVLSGELVRVGEVFQLTVKVLDGENAGTVFAALERHGNEAALLTAVDRLARDAATEVALRYGALERSAVNPLPFVGMAVGGAVAAGGAVLLGLAAGDSASLRRGAPEDYDAAVTLKQSGELKQGVGIGLVAAGGAVLLGSIAWRVLGGSGAPKVALVPSPGGLGVWGSF